MPSAFFLASLPEIRRSPMRIASTICLPTVITGFSENFGSCRIIPMRPPRSERRSFGLADLRSIPSKFILSTLIRA
mgnify:CR=1 FL=1